MASRFEAMGGYESAPVEEEDQPATPKRRRVDEYTMKLTKQQWYVLEALVDGAKLSRAAGTRLFLLTWHDKREWHGGNTATSLVNRGLICNSETAPQVYTLTDAGRHALRIREQNKPGQI